MTDIKHTEDGDLDLSTGDLLYATSDYQHQKDILLARKGHYKEHPETGVGIEDYRNETDPEELLRAIRQEFASDGMKVSKVRLGATGQLETDASYENS
ncbi:MAG: hypothetical protein NC357_09265 [Bacteroides sp.]|nr:hypothetical protein [Bacteroides sp.]